VKDGSPNSKRKVPAKSLLLLVGVGQGQIRRILFNSEKAILSRQGANAPLPLFIFMSNIIVIRIICRGVANRYRVCMGCRRQQVQFLSPR
jgi:hypothetical protein